MTLQIDDENRVRTLTLNRPEALNAFNEALYDATAQALLDTADDSEVAVLLLTGTGRGFSAGTDLAEMQARITDPDFTPGRYGFPGLIDALSKFPKPLICAVNGVGVGIGATILGYADLAFMSSTARLKCPFTSLGVAPEAASSYLLPQLVGRQNAAWLLMSSEWVDAEEALRMGLVWRGQAHDRRTDPSGNRSRHRARKRSLRRADGRASKCRGAGRFHQPAQALELARWGRVEVVRGGDDRAQRAPAAPAIAARPACGGHLFGCRRTTRDGVTHRLVSGADTQAYVHQRTPRRRVSAAELPDRTGRIISGV